MHLVKTMDPERREDIREKIADIYKLFPQGSGGSYCQGRTADFGHDTNIDPFTETVTELVALLITRVTLSIENSNAVPSAVISDVKTASGSIIRKYKNEMD